MSWLGLVKSAARYLTGRSGGRGRGGAWKSPAPVWGLLQFALALATGLLELIHDGGVGEGRDIPQVVLALGDAAEDAAHDLPLLVFGRSG